MLTGLDLIVAHLVLRPFVDAYLVPPTASTPGDAPVVEEDLLDEALRVGQQWSFSGASAVPSRSPSNFSVPPLRLARGPWSRRSAQRGGRWRSSRRLPAGPAGRLPRRAGGAGLRPRPSRRVCRPGAWTPCSSLSSWPGSRTGPPDRRSAPFRPRRHPRRRVHREHLLHRPAPAPRGLPGHRLPDHRSGLDGAYFGGEPTAGAVGGYGALQGRPRTGSSTSVSGSSPSRSPGRSARRPGPWSTPTSRPGTPSSSPRRPATTRSTRSPRTSASSMSCAPSSRRSTGCSPARSAASSSGDRRRRPACGPSRSRTTSTCEPAMPTEMATRMSPSSPRSATRSPSMPPPGCARRPGGSAGRCSIWRTRPTAARSSSPHPAGPRRAQRGRGDRHGVGAAAPRPAGGSVPRVAMAKESLGSPESRSGSPAKSGSPPAPPCMSPTTRARSTRWSRRPSSRGVHHHREEGGPLRPAQRRGEPARRPGLYRPQRLGPGPGHLDALVERIHGGTSLLIFPEGTRSATPTLGRFRKGGFHVAIQAQVPVVPLVLRNTGEILPRHGRVLRPGSSTWRSSTRSRTSAPRISTVGRRAAGPVHCRAQRLAGCLMAGPVLGAGADRWAADDSMNELETAMWRAERHPQRSSTLCSLLILDQAPTGTRLVAAHEWATSLIGQARQRVVEPLPVGTPVWRADPHFKLDYHLRRLHLGPRKSMADLLTLAQTIAQVPFDRTRPLWEATLIEGWRAAGRHTCSSCTTALTDGLGAVQLLAPRAEPDPGAHRRQADPSHRSDRGAGRPGRGDPRRGPAHLAHGTGLLGAAVDTARHWLANPAMSRPRPCASGPRCVGCSRRRRRPVAAAAAPGWPRVVFRTLECQLADLRGGGTGRRGQSTTPTWRPCSAGCALPRGPRGAGRRAARHGAGLAAAGRPRWAATPSRERCSRRRSASSTRRTGSRPCAASSCPR